MTRWARRRPPAARARLRRRRPAPGCGAPCGCEDFVLRQDPERRRLATSARRTGIESLAERPHRDAHERLKAIPRDAQLVLDPRARAERFGDRASSHVATRERSVAPTSRTGAIDAIVSRALAARRPLRGAARPRRRSSPTRRRSPRARARARTRTPRPRARASAPSRPAANASARVVGEIAQRLDLRELDAVGARRRGRRRARRRCGGRRSARLARRSAPVRAAAHAGAGAAAGAGDPRGAPGLRARLCGGPAARSSRLRATRTCTAPSGRPPEASRVRQRLRQSGARSSGSAPGSSVPACASAAVKRGRDRAAAGTPSATGAVLERRRGGIGDARGTSGAGGAGEPSSRRAGRPRSTRAASAARTARERGVASVMRAASAARMASGTAGAAGRARQRPCARHRQRLRLMGGIGDVLTAA